jgi:uncharacterized membrane protein
VERDLWYDEAIGLFNARGTDFVPQLHPNGPEFTNEVFTRDDGVRGLLGAISHTEDTPPFYFLVLRLWIKTFGDATGTLRLLSVIFGLATILMVFFFGRALFNRQTGLVAAALLSLSPIHIQFSQEVRAYSLALLLVIGASWVYWRAQQAMGQRREWKPWGLYAGLVVLSLYTHYFTAAIFIAHGLFALLQPPAVRLAVLKRLIAVFLIGIVFAVPWLSSSYLTNQFGLKGFPWHKQPLWTGDTLEVFVNSLCYLFAGWRAEITYKSVIGLTLLVVSALGLLSLIRRPSEVRPAIVYSLLHFLLPIFFVIGVAIKMGASNPLIPPKYILPALIGMILLLAAAMTTSHRFFSSVFIAAACLVVSLSFVVRFIGNPDIMAHPYWQRNYGRVSETIRTVAAQVKPNELILLQPYITPVWNAYYTGSASQAIMATTRFYSNQPRDLVERWQEIERTYDGIFLVHRLGEVPGELLIRLSPNYRQVARERADTLEIRHYVKVSP